MAFFNLQKHIGNDIEIDCYDMQLFAKFYKNGDEPFVKGPGWIKISKSGEINYKIYDQLRVNDINLTYWKLFTDDNTNQQDIECQLIAISYDNMKWISKKHLLWTSFTLVGFPPPVSCDINKISVISQNPEDEFDSQCLIYIPGSLPFHYNTCTNTTVLRNGKMVSQNYVMDSHKTTINGYPLEIVSLPDKNYVRIMCECAKEELEMLPDWVIGALSICSGKPLEPYGVIRFHNHESKCTIKKVSSSFSTMMIRPGIPYVSGVGDGAWKLFNKLVTVSRNEFQSSDDEIMKDIFDGYREVCLAGKETISEFLLSLAIYIEKCLSLNDSTEMNEEDQNDIDALKNIVKCSSLELHNKELGKRALGLLSMLSRPSVNNKLRQLCKQKVITEEEIATWIYLRPKLAHGHKIDENQIVEYEKYKNDLLCLMYRIIFNKIGYNIG